MIRLDAYFFVSIAESLVTGESFTFSLYDDESTLISSNTLTAAFGISFFGRTFFPDGVSEVLDGIGFITVKRETLLGRLLPGKH